MGAVKKIFSAVTGGGRDKEAEAARQRQAEAEAAAEAKRKSDFDAEKQAERDAKASATTTAAGVSNSANNKRITARKGRSGLVNRRGTGSETRSGVSVPR